MKKLLFILWVVLPSCREASQSTLNKNNEETSNKESLALAMESSVTDDTNDPEQCTKEEIVAVCKKILATTLSDESCSGYLRTINRCGLLDCDLICADSQNPILCTFACKAYQSDPDGIAGKKFKDEFCKTLRNSFKKMCAALVKKIK